MLRVFLSIVVGALALFSRADLALGQNSDFVTWLRSKGASWGAFVPRSRFRSNPSLRRARLVGTVEVRGFKHDVDFNDVVMDWGTEPEKVALTSMTHWSEIALNFDTWEVTYGAQTFTASVTEPLLAIAKVPSREPFRHLAIVGGTCNCIQVGSGARYSLDPLGVDVDVGGLAYLNGLFYLADRGKGKLYVLSLGSSAVVLEGSYSFSHDIISLACDGECLYSTSGEVIRRHDLSSASYGGVLPQSGLFKLGVEIRGLCYYRDGLFFATGAAPVCKGVDLHVLSFD